MRLKAPGIILVWLASIGLSCAGTNDIETLVQRGLFEEEANHHLDAAAEDYLEAIGKLDKERQLAAIAIFHLGECYRLQGKTNESNLQYERIVREFSDQVQLVELSRNYLAAQTTGGLPTSFIVVGADEEPQESREERDEIQRIKDIVRNSPDLINAITSGEDNPPLEMAARKGWMLAAKLLLENGAIINPTGPAHFATPLGEAAMAGNKGMVEFLISKGANVNALDDLQGFAPLHYAAQLGFKSVAETLLAHGADVNLPSRPGDRPLHLAVSSGYGAMAEFLLAHHADVNARGGSGETPIFKAVRAKNPELLALLISNKADVNVKGDSGTALFLAVENNNVKFEVVKQLLDSGADPEVTASRQVQYRFSYDRRTITPLIQLIYNGYNAPSQIASLLLQHGANPNHTDDKGESPLEYAIRYNKVEIIRALLAFHADVNLPDKEGQPPLAYDTTSFQDQVSEDIRNEIRKLLVDAGANEDYQRRGGMFITQQGTGSIGREVFSKGADTVSRYTLLDLIAAAYVDGGPFLPFPDFAHVIINRLKTDGRKEEIPVDLTSILNSGDCSKNPPLDWGDVVLIPQLDHNVNEGWPGLSQTNREILRQCLTRKVTIIVKGQTNQIELRPAVDAPRRGIPFPGRPYLPPGTPKYNTVLYMFTLNEVVRGANVLLISSDLSRVKLTRPESGTNGHPLVMTFDLNGQPPPFPLCDGDVIEIPERDETR